MGTSEADLAGYIWGEDTVTGGNSHALGKTPLRSALKVLSSDQYCNQRGLPSYKEVGRGRDSGIT